MVSANLPLGKPSFAAVQESICGPKPTCWCAALGLLSGVKQRWQALMVGQAVSWGHALTLPAQGLDDERAGDDATIDDDAERDGAEHAVEAETGFLDHDPAGDRGR